jgi:hypothetical protein
MTTPGPIASGLFANNYAGIVDVAASSAPTSGQVLTATVASDAEWNDNVTSNVFFALDSVGNTLVTLSYQTMIYDTVVISNPMCSLSSGEIDFNETGTYYVSYSICFRNRVGGTTTFKAMEALIQLDTGGGFADITGTLGTGTVRDGGNLGDFQCTNTKSIFLQVTSLPTTIRVRFKQVRYTLTTETVPNQNIICIGKLA